MSDKPKGARMTFRRAGQAHDDPNKGANTDFVEGYLVKSPQPNAPGVVMIQEWWGLQDQITGLADRLAASGFDVLAPDFYAGTIVPYHDPEAASREMSSLNFVEAVDDIARGAALHLLGDSKKVGMVGFCMGGAMTALSAARLPELSCGVIFYGLPPLEIAPPADIKIPIQGHFALKDDWCTPAMVETFEAGLKQAGASYEFYSYDGDHAFMNEQRESVHDSRAAELAWARAIAFLKKNLAS